MVPVPRETANAVFLGLQNGSENYEKTKATQNIG